MSELRAYIVFGRPAGPLEGAFLVFARTAREARRLGWPWASEWLCEEFIHLGVRWVRGGADYHRIAEKEEAGEPYVVEAPEACDHCECWYADGLNEDGECQDCAEGLPREWGP